MKADLRQDINGGYASTGALMEHFLEGKTPLRLWKVISEEKICKSSHLC